MKKLNVNTVNHDEWLTPPEIIKAFPEFDLDPCAPINRPWPTARAHYTKDDDGLQKDWQGCVWMNPPYGSECQKWLAKLAEHGNGIALVFARTETKMFQKIDSPPLPDLCLCQWFTGILKEKHLSLRSGERYRIRGRGQPRQRQS